MPANTGKFGTMRAETNLRTGRYREHRQQLTRFSKSTALSPKYAFFAELILLWLDCVPAEEDKMWALMMYYVSNAKPSRGYKEDFDNREDGDTPLDLKTKEKIKKSLALFLGEEEE